MVLQSLRYKLLTVRRHNVKPHFVKEMMKLLEQDNLFLLRYGAHGLVQGAIASKVFGITIVPAQCFLPDRRTLSEKSL